MRGFNESEDILKRQARVEKKKRLRRKAKNRVARQSRKRNRG